MALAQAQAPTPALPGRKRKRETHLTRAQGRDYGLADHGPFKSCERISGISAKNITIHVRKDTSSLSRSLCDHVLIGFEICRIKFLAGSFNLRATTNFLDPHALFDRANAKYQSMHNVTLRFKKIEKAEREKEERYLLRVLRHNE